MNETKRIDLTLLDRSEQIEFRKSIYRDLFDLKKEMNDEYLSIINDILETCPSNKPRYDIPFYKKAITYLEKIGDSINLVKYYNKYVSLPLTHEVREGNSFSDFDLAYLSLFKLYCKENMTSERDELYVTLEDKVSSKTYDFIEYNLCKSYFQNQEYKKAFSLFDKIILVNREVYVITLPLKYYDLDNEYSKIPSLICEILSLGFLKSKMYIYKYIFNWFKRANKKISFEDAEDVFEIDNSLNIKINDFRAFKSKIIEFLISNNLIIKKTGKIINIMKSKNGFVVDNDSGKSFFVKKSNLSGSRKGNSVEFILIDVIKDDKIIKNAIILRRIFNGKE